MRTFSASPLRRRSVGPALLTAGLVATGALAPHASHAQSVSKAGTTAATFLSIGVGARAMGQGSAYVASADDVTSLYWNAAGLARMTRGEVAASHSAWLGDLQHDHLAAAMPLAGGVAAVGVTSLRVPEMLVRTEDRQEGTGETYDAQDLALSLAYARQVTDRFSIGGTVKMVQQRIWNESARGFAVDLGTQFRTDLLGGLVVGASVTNFGTPMRLDGRDLAGSVDPNPTQNGTIGDVPTTLTTESWDLPLTFQIGVAVRPIQTRMQQLTLSLDALHPSDNYESLNLGAEYGVRGRFFLRGGYEGVFLPEQEGGISGGVAARVPLPYEGGEARVDYGYRGAGRLGGAHVVSVGLTF